MGIKSKRGLNPSDQPSEVINQLPQAKRSRGFTLVELMVVTLIIGLLVGLSLAAMTGAKKSARDGKRKADLEQIRSALEMYKADEEEYPANTGLLVSGNYLSEMPVDPSGYAYYYNRTSSREYQLCAYLETGGPDDCGNNCSAPGNCNWETKNP